MFIRPWVGGKELFEQPLASRRVFFARNVLNYIYWMYVRSYTDDEIKTHCASEIALHVNFSNRDQTPDSKAHRARDVKLVAVFHHAFRVIILSISIMNSTLDQMLTRAKCKHWQLTFPWVDWKGVLSNSHSRLEGSNWLSHLDVDDGIHPYIMREVSTLRLFFITLMAPTWDFYTVFDIEYPSPGALRVIFATTAMVHWIDRHARPRRETDRWFLPSISSESSAFISRPSIPLGIRHCWMIFIRDEIERSELQFCSWGRTSSPEENEAGNQFIFYWVLARGL